MAYRYRDPDPIPHLASHIQTAFHRGCWMHCLRHDFHLHLELSFLHLSAPCVINDRVRTASLRVLLFWFKTTSVASRSILLVGRLTLD